MPASAWVHPNLIRDMLKGDVDIDTHDIRAALLVDAHTPDRADDRWDDVVADECSGAGYTADGVAVANLATVTTQANSWGTAWAAATAYAVGDIVKPVGGGNGHVYICVVAGTSDDPTEPTWPTVSRQIVADNDITWAEFGSAVVGFTCDPIVFSEVTVSARYVKIFDHETAVNSTSPLMIHVDLGSEQVTGGADLTVTPAAIGAAVVGVS